MRVLSESSEAIVSYCEHCRHKFIVRVYEGRPERKKYAKLYKRDTLQPHENLYYKVYPRRMNVI
jgi:hypothetical protein